MALIPTQDHIHLDLTVDAGGEKAPPKKWDITSRKKVPIRFMNIRHSLNGVPRVHILRNSEGAIVELVDFLYIVRVQDENTNVAEDLAETLMSMMGKVVYLVDSKHPNNGSDHAAYVRKMIVEAVNDLNVDDIMLRRYEVEIRLKDARLLPDES